VTLVFFAASLSDRLYQFDLNSISVLEERETSRAILSTVKPTELSSETAYLH
jgi:hypothetical protein